ncbi:MAG: hypothetical protein NTZ56_00795 [Acidobacteria bacterium]|nr:hypothetical protein [Acidobacteriota bacterium]
MNTFRTSPWAATALLLYFGSVASIAAAPQKDKQNHGREKQERRQQQVQERRSQQQARTWQKQRTWAPQGSWPQNRGWNQHQSPQWHTQHRSWPQRGGYGGYVIPQNRFVLQFGSQHGFRLQNRPAIIGGYPRFRYGGYQFMMVDPWPEGWGPNWYSTDDVYIDYDDGYYLYNRRDPGIGIAISIVF